jgi:hypothetical protein
VARLLTPRPEHDYLERNTRWIGAEFAGKRFGKRLNDPIWINTAVRLYLAYQRIAEYHRSGKRSKVANDLIQAQHRNPEVRKPSSSQESLIGSGRW